MTENNYTTTGDNQPQNVIDIREIFTTLWQNRKVFYWVLPITFIVSAALILCVPRYYTCKVILAPEMQNTGGSSLQSLASSFGFDINSMTGTDALYPMIYPDIVSSPDFLVTLFDKQVSTADGEFSDTYYNYIQTKLKAPFWKRWKAKLFSMITPKSKEVVFNHARNSGFNIFCMSKKQWEAILYMQDNIKCNVDKKTDVITLNTTTQDPLVCAMVADSVCTALQAFITEYRTAKCRTDLAYYENVMEDAYREYQEASEKYIRYADSHSGIQLEQYRIKARNLESEMQLKQSAYTSIQKQYLATQARLQENTPVYTVIQSASIPLKPAGPGRVSFVLVMLFLATAVTCCVLCKNQLWTMLSSN